MATRSWCSTSPTFRSSTPQRSSRANGWKSIGFKVILKGMDWSTNLVVRARKEPPDKGGWNLLHTWWRSGGRRQSCRPLRHVGRGRRAPGSAGRTSRSSRSLSPTGCARPIKRNGSSSPTRSRRSLSAKCTYVPWGEWVQPTAFRKNVRDVLKFGAPIFWNVKVT